jgi:KTSC domain
MISVADRSPMNAALLSLLSLLVALPLTGAESTMENALSEHRYPAVSHILREQVRSSVIASIGYSKRRHILEIEFVNGAVYRYLAVASPVYRDLLAADSKARYYDTNIRRKYISVRVRPRTGASKH